jgi:trehalose 6-phosphate phosphatase
MGAASPLERFRQAPRRGFVLDFDGTLSEIVARPEIARIVPGAAELLARLAETNPLVAVVSGRPADQIRKLIAVPAVKVVGLYGLAQAGPGGALPGDAREDVRRAARMVSGTWMEDKGPSLAVHYRAAADTVAAEGILTAALRRVATAHGLSMLPGKMVIELAAGQVPGKGAVVRALAGDAKVGGCLYAGDDLPDIDAFAALDRLEEAGVAAVKVAVRSEETPSAVLDAADLVVDRPAGLVRLLSGL